MAASHRSMRDRFQITVPSLDRLVVIAQQAIGSEGSAWMTGGGYGGCIVAQLPLARVDAVRAAIEANDGAPSGVSAAVWVCQLRDGLGPVALTGGEGRG